MSMLPSQFSALEPFAEAGWVLQAESDRWAKRHSTPMAELSAFYDAGMANIDEALNYIDQFSLEDMPEDALNLMFLLYSLVTISFTVECWGQPKIPDTGAADVHVVLCPVP